MDALDLGLEPEDLARLQEYIDATVAAQLSTRLEALEALVEATVDARLQKLTKPPSPADPIPKGAAEDVAKGAAAGTAENRVDAVGTGIPPPDSTSAVPQPMRRRRQSRLVAPGGGDGAGGLYVGPGLAAAGGNAPTQTRMRGLRIALICFTVLPQLLLGVFALVRDSAAVHMMAWVFVPIGILCVIVHYMITVELSEKPGFLESFHLACCFVTTTVTFAPFWGLKLGPWYGIGIGIYSLLAGWIDAIMFAKIRASVRRYQAAQGTLGEFVDGTFLLFLEFAFLSVYGCISASSCLSGVEAEDPGDLLDKRMYDIPTTPPA